MNIYNSETNDIDEIFRLYRLATAHQVKVGSTISWPEFDRQMVATELQEKRQWKMLSGADIACVWATTYDDPKIWGERNAEPSVYIHRIATNPEYRGQNLVTAIVAWARQHALENDKRFIRIDTVGNNKKLIAHYQSCGFRFLGLETLADTTGLPVHYSYDKVCLFEISL